MAKSVYEHIKKQNGEHFAKAIRNYDNGVFDIPNIVDIVKYAGHIAEPILPYLISLKNLKIEETQHPEDPLVLLDRAGYDAYYVHTLAEQNAIARYFEPGEELCTFRDPTRFQKYHIINAVKKNVQDIQRKDFIGKEKREDEYGTSVISIQVLTTGGFISIKNRYNHTVKNPDNTFNSNPDNIITGLSAAIKQHLGVDFSSQKARLPYYFVNMNDKIIHYNQVINNIYFGENFYAKDGQVHPLKTHEIMMDTCILNLRDRTLRDPSISPAEFRIDDITENTGSFISILANEFKNKKLHLQKNKANNSYEILADDVSMVKLYQGNIIGLHLPTTKEVGYDFLQHNTSLQELDMPNVQRVGSNFLLDNTILNSLNMPNLRHVENNFLACNLALDKLELPCLQTVGHDFLHDNRDLRTLTLPQLQHVKRKFLYYNEQLITLNVPALQKVGDYFLGKNEKLTTLNAPCLKSADYMFLPYNSGLTTLSLPNLQEVEDAFLFRNLGLSSLDTPNLRKVGAYFLAHNKNLTTLNMPKLQETDHSFLMHNTGITHANLPSLKKIAPQFMPNNKTLTTLTVKKLDVPTQIYLLEKWPKLKITQTGGLRNYFQKKLGLDPATPNQTQLNTSTPIPSPKNQPAERTPSAGFLRKWFRRWSR